eukprot:TRINITY_DN22411_c0_g1_i1.p1 TRINITY_DN22411_c0_g1~~TRINITY_DN22411_c0_g1_i1.p1  ORF type:complete len:346 (+),score=38.50 TRINITY_DN22411_c0_g1_i1:49-1086(+)
MMSLVPQVQNAEAQLVLQVKNTFLNAHVVDACSKKRPRSFSVPARSTTSETSAPDHTCKEGSDKLLVDNSNDSVEAPQSSGEHHVKDAPYACSLSPSPSAGRLTDVDSDMSTRGHSGPEENHDKLVVPGPSGTMTNEQSSVPKHPAVRSERGNAILSTSPNEKTANKDNPAPPNASSSAFNRASYQAYGDAMLASLGPVRPRNGFNVRSAPKESKTFSRYAGFQPTARGSARQADRSGYGAQRCWNKNSNEKNRYSKERMVGRNSNYAPMMSSSCCDESSESCHGAFTGFSPELSTLGSYHFPNAQAPTFDFWTCSSDTTMMSTVGEAFYDYEPPRLVYLSSFLS